MLEKDEIEQGLLLVKRKHPLYDVAIWKTLPFLDLDPVKKAMGKVGLPRVVDEVDAKREAEAAKQENAQIANPEEAAKNDREEIDNLVDGEQVQ